MITTTPDMTITSVNLINDIVLEVLAIRNAYGTVMTIDRFGYVLNDYQESPNYGFEAQLGNLFISALPTNGSVWIDIYDVNGDGSDAVSRVVDEVESVTALILSALSR